MANSSPEKNRIAEFIILLIVLICVLLIVADLRINVVDQLDSQESQGVINNAHVNSDGSDVYNLYLNISVKARALQATTLRSCFYFQSLNPLFCHFPQSRHLLL